MNPDASTSARARAGGGSGAVGKSAGYPAAGVAAVTLRQASALLLVAAVLLWPGAALRAGGGVMLAKDTCILEIGFYRAHFTAYQPRTRGDEEFCRDLPDTGETVIVLDYLHDNLKDVPVEVRVLRNATGLGRFVRLEDLQEPALPAAATVAHHAPSVEADASLQIDLQFDQPGEFVAIITAGHPTKDKTYTAVFPFRVAMAGFPWGWVLGPGVLVLAALVYLWLRARPRPAQGVGAPT